MTPDIQRVQAALAYIPAHDRDTWLNMGMAVKDALGDQGFEIWNDWSQTAEDKYNPRDARAVWNSIKPGKVRAGSLFHEAKQRGYKPTGQRIDAAELERQRKQRADSTAKAAAELAAVHAKVRDQAQEIWKRCGALTAHDYVTAKGIKAYGARLYKGPLIISGIRVDGPLVAPAHDTAGVIHTLQYITPKGEKLFPHGSAKSGHYFAIGKPAQRIIVCEGYATACSIHEATGEAVAVAFDRTNLAPVAAAIRGKYPDLELVIAADNDAWTDGNPGVKNATGAAQAVNARLAIPTFKDCTSKPTDFNDLHKLEGLDAVRAQIERAEDPKQNAVTNSDLADEVKKLAAMSPLDYERVRVATAERLNVRTTVLDAEVKKLRAPDTTQPGAGKALGIEDVEPCPGPVDGVQLLEKIVSAIRRFVALPEQADIALALWAVHTYAFNYDECSPILALISPTPRCGKTTTLNLLARLVNRPLSAANISTPSLFRTVEVCQPTLLIDEADTFMRENLELRGVINSGHTRDSAYVIRTVGDDHEPRQFSTWAPKAIASISKLPGTITDRSIVISLRRKLPSDRVTRLTRQHQFHDLRAQVARWVIDHAGAITAANPDIPEELNDRAADNWRPLLALADLMGGQWTEIARRAAKTLSGERDEEAQGVLLLSDIRAIFRDKKTDRMPSKTLAEALAAIEGRPWAEFRNGKPITANQLARILSEFGISPASTRSGDDTFKGYVLDKFSEVFERYLQNAQSGGEQKVTQSQPNAGGGCDTSQTVTSDLGVTLRKPSQANTGAGCDGVTLREGEKGRFHDIASPAGDEVVV